MSLRTRLTLAAGGAVLASLTIASLAIYFSVRAKLHDQIDAGLVQSAQNVETKTSFAGAKKGPLLPATPILGTDASGYFQLIPSVSALLGGTSEPGIIVKPAPTTSTATTTIPPTKVGPKTSLAAPNGFIPLTGEDELVASGAAPAYFRTVEYHNVQMRVYALRVERTSDGLVRTARPLSEANATVARVRWLLIGLTLGGALAAALVGRLAAAAVLRPVRALASTVRGVTATRELDRRIEVATRDEVGSLAGDFNAMLEALQESQRVQQQLIADASHELRTPLTAHRANVELLARADLPTDRRPQVLGAAVRAIEELSKLVDDLIQAARNGRPVDAREQVELAQVVASAVTRVGARTPAVRFETNLEPYTVSAAPARLERAIDNILDNAAKWSPPGEPVEVALGGGELTVRDHGPGIDESDLPHVFDRFYRSAAARSLPGSGLGLAIVKQTVDDHGGAVRIANADGGGTVVTLRFDALTNL